MEHLTELRNYMKEKGIDAVLSLDELNQRYLSGFAFTDGYLLITQTNAWLVTDFRYTEHAQGEAYRDFFVIAPENRKEWLSATLASEGVKTIAMEAASVAYATYTAYQKQYPSIEFVDLGDRIEQLRQRKSDVEIAYMQKAQDITDAAFSHICAMLTPNMTEMDVACELEYAMRKGGAEGFAFDTIAVSGDASALPHGTPRNVKLKSGFLTMDFGAKYKGYCSDMTRTVVIGRADAEMRGLYQTVLDAQTVALSFLKEGVDCGEADKIARDIIDRDYKGTFGHSLGHSVGLFIHESPRLSKTAFGRKLRKNEIVTVEPGIYLTGKYGCRIEDMVQITENGIMNFTHSPKDLIEIG